MWLNPSLFSFLITRLHPYKGLYIFMYMQMQGACKTITNTRMTEAIHTFR